MLKPIIVRHLGTNVPYQYLGQNTFKNLTTGVEGNVSDEVAQRSFVINMDATELFYEHPILLDLVHTLKLKFDK